MADYPNTITDPRVVANKPGTEYDAAKTTRLFAEDHNGLADEIVAIETDLLETKPPLLTKIETGIYFQYLTACKLLLAFQTPSDAGTETDQSGLGHNATYADSSDWSASNLLLNALVNVLHFDGINDYLTIADTDDLSFGNGAADSAFSIGFWYNVQPGTTSRSIINKYISTAGLEAREWSFVLTSDEKLVTYFYDESADKQPMRITDSAISTGWHFICITYDPALGSGATFATGITIYIDGVVVASTATNNASYVAMENTTAEIAIGVSRTPSATGNWLRNDLGRLFITKETLTAATIWKMYQATRGFYGV